MSESLLGLDPFQNKIRVDQSDRREHMYLLGASGTGKSTLLTSLILQDIKQGLGVAVIEPHGSLIENVLRGMQSLPNPRYNDVIYLDINSKDYVWGMNLFQCSDVNDIFAVENTINQVMTLLNKVYDIDYNTPHMYQFFLNLTQTFIYNPPYGFLDVPRLFSDKTFTLGLAANVPNAQVQWFWKNFFENKSKHQQTEDYNSIVNKLDEFFRPVLKTIFGQQTSTIDLRKIMDERKILFCRLNARWESLTKITGTSLVAALLDAAYSRQNIAQNKRKQFNAYFDEFQWFESQLFAQLFSEARKWGLACTISHQVLEQIEDPSILATCQQAKVIISYRVSGKNGIDLASSFDSTPEPEETGKRKKQAPVHDVIGALRSKGNHQNPIVNNFLHTRLSRVEQLRPEVLPALNDLFFEQMTVLPSLNFFPDLPYLSVTNSLYIRELIHSLTDSPYYVWVFDICKTWNKVKHDDKKAAEVIRKIWRESKDSFAYKQAVQELEDEVRKVIISRELDTLEGDLLFIEELRKGEADNPDKPIIREVGWPPMKFPGFEKYAVSISNWKDSLRKGIKKVMSNQGFMLPIGSWYTIEELIQWAEMFHRLTTNLNPQQVNQIISTHGYQLDQVATAALEPGKTRILNFMEELKEVCKALANDPILGDSGQEEITYKKGSHADKQKEIANMLSGLPNYTAYTRIGGDIQFCWSCGKKADPGHYCGYCGKKFKNEYTISVTPPPMSPVDVKAVINKIIQQNFRDSYLHKRSDVEDEINKRQQKPVTLAAPVQPAQKQKVATPVAAQAAPIPRKRAIATPVGKQCPDCGVQNNPTANFCQGCGKKL